MEEKIEVCIVEVCTECGGSGRVKYYKDTNCVCTRCPKCSGKGYIYWIDEMFND